MPPAKISLIVAHDRNRCIGKDNKMLFHLPNDLKNFKRLTMGKPVIMGRNTYESIGRALPGRINIIVSRRLTDNIPNSKVCRDLDEAINHAEQLISNKQIAADEIMIIGGGDIYEQAIARAHRLLVTSVDEEADGDTYFPAYAEQDWRETHSESHQDGDISWTFRILERAN